MPHWCCISCILLLHVYLSLVSAGNTSIVVYYNTTQLQSECICEYTTKEINDGDCLTSENEGQYYHGRCPISHNFNRTNRMSSELPCNPCKPDQLNRLMCDHYNRKGLLCRKCREGYGLAVYSYDQKCVDCSKLSIGYAITVYLILEFIPVTLFFICIVIFRLNITSGPLLGYVLFSQYFIFYIRDQIFIYDYMQSHLSAFLKLLLYVSVTVSDLWSMNFLKTIMPPFCISDKLTGIHIEMLALMKNVYTIVLVIITCILMELHARNYRIIHILCKPFNLILNKINITAVTGDAVVHDFATFILLTNFNVYLIAYNAANTINVYRDDSSVYKTVLYIDPTIESYSPKHIVYILLVAATGIIVTLIPSLLLCIYPTRIYRYLSQFISARKRLVITAFAEALHKCFKDGLSDTRDYRAFAGLLMLFPIPYSTIRYIFIIIGYSKSSSSLLTIMMYPIITSYIKPCKSSISNLSLVYHFYMLGIMYFAYYLWEGSPNVPTETLELTLIIIPLVSHILVFIWAGYMLIHYILTHFQCQLTDVRVALTDFATGVKQLFHRRHDHYQELN